MSPNNASTHRVQVSLPQDVVQKMDAYRAAMQAANPLVTVNRATLIVAACREWVERNSPPPGEDTGTESRDPDPHQAEPDGG